MHCTVIQPMVVVIDVLELPKTLSLGSNRVFQNVGNQLPTYALNSSP